MTDRRIAFVSMLLGLLASIMACFQLHLAMLNVQGDYARRRRNIIRLLSLPVSKTGGNKRLNRGRQARPRRFWVRPGRTSVWWDTFVDQIVNAHTPIKIGTVFSNCCILVWTGKDDSKAKRVDADFFFKGEKNSPFSNKNGYVWTGPKRLNDSN